MTTDTGDFDFHRTLPLGTDQLWHVLTDANMRERWGAPSPEMILKVEKSDLRVGGIERHICGPKKNPEFEVETRWYRLDAPSDAAFTETVEIGGSAIGTSLVTYRLEAKGKGTQLFVHVALSSFCGAEALSEFKDGWQGGLASLDALAHELAAE
ncbi:SRPBCC domain-containing protein [Planktotalea arctica]|uniref:SRPBCC domain-containing protein n=1 Tax=Planktotalea arctica TaxID=1481893 RepID=UPI000A171053|nr:SRPBCC domain-containing protein [Planktotalea arctica]